VLTHRAQIVRLALQGKTTSQICKIMHHSAQAVANYLSTFARCVQLHRRDMQVGQIAFLLRRGPALIQRYLELLGECQADKNMTYHLDELLRLGNCGGEKKADQGGDLMGSRRDHVRNKFAPLQQKTLQNALAHRIAEQFPRIGGPRNRELCADMILEVIDQHLRPREHIRHGQVLWTAVSLDDPPHQRKRTADTDLVPVLLDLSTPDDIHRRLDRLDATQRLLQKALRLCRQAHEQGGLLSNCDLAELLSHDDSRISQLLVEYERSTNQVVPRRATLHDVGTGLTHKRIICRKRYAEGKEAHLVAQETNHSLDAVDRYLAQYDRVRHCRLQGLTPEETAQALDCTVSLVKEYLDIDRELDDHHA